MVSYLPLVGCIVSRVADGAVPGPLNVITPANVVAAIMTYAWPFAKDTGGFAVIAILYGYASAIPSIPSPLILVRVQCCLGCFCVAARVAHRAHG